VVEGGVPENFDFDPRLHFTQAVCGWRHEGFLFAMARHRDVRLGDVSQSEVRPNANRRRRLRIEDLRRDWRDDRNGAAALALQRRATSPGRFAHDGAPSKASSFRMTTPALRFVANHDNAIEH
jgi:hypothetical protein